MARLLRSIRPQTATCARHVTSGKDTRIHSLLDISSDFEMFGQIAQRMHVPRKRVSRTICTNNTLFKL